MATRHEGSIGLMLIDLDHFKQLNDTWGHEAGDQALRIVAQRLQNIVRETDLVARLGGDEFGIILTHLHSRDDLHTLAKRTLDELSQPMQIEGRLWPLTCSIGLTDFPTDASNAEDLLRCADLAMYQAKRSHAPGYRYYDSGIHRRIRQKTEMELELRQALSNQRLLLYYQPLIDMQQEKIIGAEVLLRLRGQNDQLILPEQFIHIAEETGLIDPIGEWILKQTCEDIARWQQQGMQVPRIAINVSARQFRDPSFARRILKILDECHVSPECFELEITESVLLGNEETTLGLLHELRDTGLALTIDDFGIGYSSLSYLRRLPVSKLKIDRSFIMEMLQRDDASAIVDAILSLGNSLRLRVLAEGIEEPAQVDALLQRGCREGQGFNYFRPMPGDEFSRLLSSENNRD